MRDWTAVERGGTETSVYTNLSQNWECLESLLSQSLSPVTYFTQGGHTSIPPQTTMTAEDLGLVDILIQTTALVYTFKKTSQLNKQQMFLWFLFISFKSIKFLPD